MRKSEAFSPDYSTARQRFRQAASRLGCQLETHPIGVAGPDGDQLTLDIACSPNSDADKVLVVSSGTHGVEGFFGSAVQVGLLEQWASHSPPSLKYVFLHGLNPFGFAWLRRFDENNVDPNRNFLLAGERYEGSPAGYADLDDLLNPRRPPSRCEPFTLKAVWAIARHGMPALRQTVAAGQYEFPQGLFFGGAGPSRTHQLLGENLERWLRGSRDVVHLDFHTGLGPKGACKLLIDYPLPERQRSRLTDWFGAGSFDECDSSNLDYDARGGFGRWCVSRKIAPDYLFACAEFGTYGPIQVVAGLRAENQAHHWGTPTGTSTVRAKHRLRELFCPAAEAWRSQVLEHSFELVARAIQGLTGVASSPVGPVASEPLRSELTLEEQLDAIEVDPYSFYAPLTMEEKLRAMEIVARKLPRIIAQCKSNKAWPQCPQCDAPLRARQAQQCFHCGLDWHGRPRPEARSDPVQTHDDYAGPRAFFDFLVRSAWDDAEWTVRRSRWTEERAWEHAGVTPDEIQILKQLISPSLQNMNDQIIGIRRLSINDLEIDTGWQGGPLAGCGCRFRVRRDCDHWVVTEKRDWIS